ncbi:MAG TPA: serine/threonine-protein kinase [Planctomycetota bacterium]
MGASPFERAAERFEELAQLSVEERARALERLAEPAEVLEPLRRMLAGAAHPCAALDAPVPRAELPEWIGGFRILHLLGEGGMGRVYEAEQQAPRRRVALKVLKSAFAAPELRRRFETEAQALGRLQHPGLATVYEAGSAEVHGERVAYLAMEKVEGEALDAYLARARPTLAARVELVARVADAVHHAHEKGVVHRDLKPSNVLVEPSGRPRVLDFGIARLTGADLEVTTGHTHAGAVLGTLPYMSPEQLAGHASGVDLRTDVYALGVLLHEVLAGRRPFDLAGKTLAEAARIVAEEEPAPLGQLDARLRGDLETIAAKALAKEREQRYASAAALAEDLRRTLRHEPIVARPATTLYQLKKFARRNRRLVAALGFALLSLLAGLCASLVLALQAREQSALARERAAALELQLYRQGVAEVYRTLAEGRRERAAELLADLPRSLAGWELAHLERRLSSTNRALPRHVGGTYRLRADRAGTRLASAGPDGLRVLDAGTGALRLELDAGGQPRRFDLSGDGRHVFALGWSPGTLTASLWEEGRLVRTERHASDHMGWAECAFDAAGASVYWGWNDGLLRAWEVSTGRTRFTQPVQASDVRVLAVPEQGDWLVTGGDWGDSSLAVVERASGHVRRRLPTDWQAVAELVLLGGGPAFAARSQDGLVSLWPGPEQEPTRLDANEPILALASAPGGEQLLAGTASGRILVVDGATARLVGLHDAGAALQTLVPLPERRLLAAGTLDGRIVLLERDSGQSVGALAASPGTKAVVELLALPDGRLAAGHSNGDVALLATAPDAFRSLVGHGSYVYGVAFARGGRELVSVSWDHTLRRWDARSLRELASHPLPQRATALVTLGPERVLVATMSGEVVALDLADGAVAWRTRASPWDGSGAGLASSPDGTRVAVVDPGDARTRILAARDGTVLATATLPPRTRALAWDPADGWIAAGAPGRILFLDARTLAPRSELALEGTPQRLVPAPDGTWLAVGTREGRIEVVDVASGVPRARIGGGPGPMYALAVHPDGTRLASGSEDGRVLLWETASWTRVAELEPHVPRPPEPAYRYVWELAFAPDGQQLVSASGDHTLRLWSAAAPGE